MTTPVNPELLSVAQVAERLSVTEAAVRKWLVERRLPLVKVGRLSRIPSYALAVIAEHGLPAPNTYPRPLQPVGRLWRLHSSILTMHTPYAYHSC